jgi:signal transduction histidine kinase
MEGTGLTMSLTGGPSSAWPRRVVAAWWVLLGLLTVTILMVPPLHVAFRHDALSFTLETVSALVTTMVAFVSLARYIYERHPFDLAIAIAFACIAVSTLWFGLILPFARHAPRTLEGAPIYGWLLTRAVAIVLLLAGFREQAGHWPALSRYGWRLVGVVGFVVLADVGVWYWRADLPNLISPDAWNAFGGTSPGVISSAFLPGQTLLVIVLEVALAGLYLMLAVWLSLAVEVGAEAWLALALVTTAVAELQFVFYPAPYHPVITTVDLLWLVSYLLLLGYLGQQYVQAAAGLRRQQLRTAALLDLSQTDVTSRDPALVLDKAEGAARTVVADSREIAGVAIRLDGEVPPQASGTVFPVPIEADGVLFGSLVVHIRHGHTLDADIVEYLHLVASQTAQLIRAIDLYADLSEGAVRDERAQLARELHDGLAQDLAVLRLKLRDTPDNGVQQVAARALAEARYAITILRGQTATSGDVLEAVQRQAQELAERFGFAVSIQQDASLPDLSATMQVTLLRVSREALINAGKHGDPRDVTIRFTQTDGWLRMTVQDDGRGFDTARPVPEGHFGLRGMHERAQAAGGRVQVTSRPGAGTVVQLDVPVLPRGD